MTSLYSSTYYFYIFYDLPFFFNLLRLYVLLPPFLPLTFNLKVKCPSQDMTITSPQHMTIPMSTVYRSQLVNINFNSLAVFQSLSYTPHIAHTMDLFLSQNTNPDFFQAPCFTSIQNCLIYIVLVNSLLQP